MQARNTLFGMERFAFMDKLQIHALVCFFLLFTGFTGFTYYKLPDKGLSLEGADLTAYLGFVVFIIIYLYPIVTFVLGLIGSRRLKRRTGRYFRGRQKDSLFGR